MFTVLLKETNYYLAEWNHHHYYHYRIWSREMWLQPHQPNLVSLYRVCLHILIPYPSCFKNVWIPERSALLCFSGWLVYLWQPLIDNNVSFYSNSERPCPLCFTCRLTFVYFVSSIKISSIDIFNILPLIFTLILLPRQTCVTLFICKIILCYCFYSQGKPVLYIAYINKSTS